MKGTLSLTRIGHKLIAYAAQAGHFSRPRVTARTAYSFRDSALNSTPYFGECLRSVPPDGPPSASVHMISRENPALLSFAQWQKRTSVIQARRAGPNGQPIINRSYTQKR